MPDNDDRDDFPERPLMVDQCGDTGQVAAVCSQALGPGQQWQTVPGLVPTAAITVTAATADHTMTGLRY